MNLFYLDEDLDKCAQYHVDKHIVKMPLEAAQLLCTAIWVDEVLGFTPRALNAEEREALNSRKSEIKHLPLEERPLTPYLPMMYNHPCTIWTRSSLDNFEWVHCYANALNDEYHYRYGKLHKSVEEVINKLPDPKNMPRKGLTPFLMACLMNSKMKLMLSGHIAYTTTQIRQHLLSGHIVNNLIGGTKDLLGMIKG